MDAKYIMSSITIYKWCKITFKDEHVSQNTNYMLHEMSHTGKLYLVVLISKSKAQLQNMPKKSTATCRDVNWSFNPRAQLVARRWAQLDPRVCELTNHKLMGRAEQNRAHESLLSLSFFSFLIFFFGGKFPHFWTFLTSPWLVNFGSWDSAQLGLIIWRAEF